MAGDISSRTFQFDLFEVDEKAGELRKRGIRLKLHAQPFRLLIMLLERPQQLVTRDEIRARLWDDKTFVDFEHGVNTAMNKLREALSDSPSRPRFVETVPGKGYRFLAQVSLLLPEAAAEKQEQTIHPSVPAAGSGPVPSALAASEIPRPVVLASPEELPVAPRWRVRLLLQLVQVTYLAFYLGALANLTEIHEILWDARLLPPDLIFKILVTTATILIPVRLFLLSAVSFDSKHLAAKFRKLFPVVLLFDLLWAFSPFLLIHHMNAGLALGFSTALLYLPFAQRSLVLMYSRRLR